MDHDDLLDDLFSWSPSPSTGGDSTSATRPSPASASPSAVRQGTQMPSPPTGQRAGSLLETCVNTADTAARPPRGLPAKPADTAATPASTCRGGGAEEAAARGISAAVDASSAPRLSLPAALHARLFPHQRDGVQWLYYRHCRSRACLLADEMGLGKTVQVAAFLGQLYARQLVKTTILVVPPTLLPVWTSALSTWGDATSAPAASASPLSRLVEVIHNEPRKKRQARWRKLRYGLPCILLTTYGVLRQDAADMSATLVDYVVLDEAHLIRDPSTCVFKSALTLAARHKIALTGTPLMNTFDDLWSIFRFLDGSILDTDKNSFNSVSAMLLRGNERDASASQREAASSELAKLQAAIQPFMLRREKKDVAAEVLSSEKRDLVVWVRMSAVQQDLYAAFLESKEVATARAPGTDTCSSGGAGEVADDELDAAADRMSAEDGGGSSSSSNSASASGSAANPLLLLTMLGQICNHPWLNLTDEAFAAALKDDHRPYTAPVAEMGDVFAGAKLWVALRLIVRCIGERRKTLVFSRSKRLLRLLGFLLREWGVRHTQVDGDMPSERRCAAVDSFNANGDVDAAATPGTSGARDVVWVCLLTTQVGGVGLTFSAASAVVLLDPSWNPSADAQAVDRVHRIGQRRDVVVYRLVTCGTVEEKVYRNQIFKRMAALQSTTTTSAEAEGAAGDGASSSLCSELHRYFTRLQLRSMFVMNDVDRSTTAAQLARLHPGRVDAALRDALRGIDGVCDVSDNACILTEAVRTPQPMRGDDGEVPTRATPAARAHGHTAPPQGEAPPCVSWSAFRGMEEVCGAAPTLQSQSRPAEATPPQMGIDDGDHVEYDPPRPTHETGGGRLRARSPDLVSSDDDVVSPPRRFCGEWVLPPRDEEEEAVGGDSTGTRPCPALADDGAVEDGHTATATSVSVVEVGGGGVECDAVFSPAAGRTEAAPSVPLEALEASPMWVAGAEDDDYCDVAAGDFHFDDVVEVVHDGAVADALPVSRLSCASSPPLLPSAERVAAVTSAAAMALGDGDCSSAEFA